MGSIITETVTPPGGFQRQLSLSESSTITTSNQVQLQTAGRGETGFVEPELRKTLSFFFSSVSQSEVT